MTAQSEKSIICKKPRLTALHAGIVLTPPLRSNSENSHNMRRVTDLTSTLIKLKRVRGTQSMVQYVE
jgi:hypothetical protein